MAHAQQAKQYGRETLVVAGSLAAIFLGGLLDYGVAQIRLLGQRTFELRPYLWGGDGG